MHLTLETNSILMILSHHQVFTFEILLSPFRSMSDAPHSLALVALSV